MRSNVLWFLLLTTPVFAQVRLSLREAIDRALAGHALLEAGRARVAVAEGLRRQAGLTLNPKLILQSENTRFYGRPAFRFLHDTDNFAYLQQTIETGAKRDRRVDAAASHVRRAELERELQARQIAARVKQAYWSAAGAYRVVALLAEIEKTFAQTIEYHEVRVREGAMAEIDLLRVRLEGQRLAIATNAARLEAERARIQLFREMGSTDFPAVDFAESIDDAPPAPQGTVEEALENRAEMKLARQYVEQTRANLGLQHAIARPNVDVLFGYKRTAGLDTMLGGVQVELPFLNRNQGAIESANSEIRAAESLQAATAAMVRAEVAAARTEYDIRRKQVSESLGPMRDNAVEAASIALAAYREGGSDLLRMLDAERLRIDTQLLYIRALAEFRQSAAAVESALGY